MERLDADDRLTFRHFSNIYLRTRDAVSYSGTTKFNKEMAYMENSWHQITVNHNDQFFKEEILIAFFDALKDSIFAPIGYREGKSADKFLIPSNEKRVVKNLFRRGCKLTMPSGKPLNFCITLNVSSSSTDHISIKKVLWRILHESLQNLQTYQGEEQVLNLESISKHRECVDICLCLGNPGTLRILFEILVTSFTEKRKNIKGIVLIRNDIFDLTSFKILSGFLEELNLLDLRYNDIPQDAVVALGSLNIKNLLLSKNKFTLSYDVKCLFAKELPNVQKIDGEVLPREQVVESLEEDKKVFIMWHQVFIRHDRKFDKNQILKAFFGAVNNDLEPIYPCFYQDGNEEDNFLVKKCEKQLMYLETLGAINPVGSIRVKWDCRPAEENEMNIKQETLVAIKAGYESGSKKLNLSEFYAASPFQNIEVFLGNSNALNEVLEYTTKLYNTPQEVKILNLSQNEIRDISPFTKLSHFKYLTALDLSFNNIQNVQSLEPLSAIGKSLKSISLHGNPVCAKFFTAQQYVQCLVKLLPNLNIIDFQTVNAKELLKNEFFSSKKNYLCSLEGYDFVEFFVETFFMTCNFESKEFKKMVESFYHKDASLTYSFDFSERILQTPRYDLNLRKHRKLSRNLINKVLNTKEGVCFGHNQITTFYKDIGSLIFDLQTFSTDLAVFEPNLIVLVVNGLMTEKSLTKEADVLFSFSRTFVLRPTTKNVLLKGQSTIYKIVNDLWSTSSPTVDQHERYQSSWNSTRQEMNWKPNSTNEQHYFISMMQQITDLKPDKCEEALTSNNWDFMETLEKYENLLSKGQIPEDHYLYPSEEIQLPLEEQSQAGPSQVLPSDRTHPSPILPPMPINVKVDTMEDEEVSVQQISLPMPRAVIKKEKHTGETNVLLPKPKIKVEGSRSDTLLPLPKPLVKKEKLAEKTSTVPSPKTLVKQEKLAEKTSTVPKPKIPVKVEQIPDIKPIIKKETTRSESGKKTPTKTQCLKTLQYNSDFLRSPQPSLTIRNDLLTHPKSVTLLNLSKSLPVSPSGALSIRNDLLSDPRSATPSNVNRIPVSTVGLESTALNIRNDLLLDLRVATPSIPSTIRSSEDSSVLSRKSPALTVMRDLAGDSLRQNALPLTVISEIMRDIPGDNEDDISTDEEPEYLRNQAVKSVSTFLDDFYMENVPVLPKPGIIKSEILEDNRKSTLESSEPDLKKVKLGGLIMKEEQKAKWPIPFIDVKKEN